MIGMRVIFQNFITKIMENKTNKYSFILKKLIEYAVFLIIIFAIANFYRGFVTTLGQILSMQGGWRATDYENQRILMMAFWKLLISGLIGKALFLISEKNNIVLGKKILLIIPIWFIATIILVTFGQVYWVEAVLLGSIGLTSGYLISKCI